MSTQVQPVSLQQRAEFASTTSIGLRRGESEHLEADDLEDALALVPDVSGSKLAVAREVAGLARAVEVSDA